MKKFIFLTACIFLTSTAVLAQNSKIEILGTFGDWTAYTYADTDGKVCYMASTPEKSTGKYKIRDDVFLIVTHRLSDKTFDVVNTVAGYTYKQGSKPTIRIDKLNPITLISHADTAWAKDSATDTKLVNQMKKGGKAVLKGTSKRGTLTTDTFSLKGFSKAYAEINKACRRK